MPTEVSAAAAAAAACPRETSTLGAGIRASADVDDEDGCPSSLLPPSLACIRSTGLHVWGRRYFGKLVALILSKNSYGSATVTRPTVCRRDVGRDDGGDPASNGGSAAMAKA